VNHDRSQAPAAAAIRPFAFPRIERAQLANGITLLHAQHGDLPLVTMRAIIDAGATAERKGEEGLARLTANALETGTTTRSGADLAWELERLGAQLETVSTWDAVHVGLTTPASRMGEALALLAEILCEPAFPEREVARMRDEQLAEMLQRAADPRTLADDASTRFIYREGATYARPLIGEDETVARFQRGSALTFHRRRYTPANTALVIVGAVSRDEAQHEVERAFGKWSGAGEDVPSATSDAGPQRTTVYLVDRANAVQSELRIGHVGVARHHPDYYALLVLNGIIAGVFTSRLNLSLREKHGFTYGVRSTFIFRRAPGPFVIQTAVASDVTARAVAETLRELRELQTNGVTEEEVRNTRDYLAGTLPLELQTTEQLAIRIADAHTYGLPTTYLEHYGRQILGVSRADVERAARDHLHLDRLAIVVVGNAAAVENELRELKAGEVMRPEAQPQRAAAQSK
jgi:zinc protease